MLDRAQCFFVGCLGVIVTEVLLDGQPVAGVAPGLVGVVSGDLGVVSDVGRQPSSHLLLNVRFGLRCKCGLLEALKGWHHFLGLISEQVFRLETGLLGLLVLKRFVLIVLLEPVGEARADLSEPCIEGRAAFVEEFFLEQIVVRFALVGSIQLLEPAK